MPLDMNPRDVSVLLLYNIDPSWTDQEREDVISVTTLLHQAVSDVGHPVTMLPLCRDNLQEVMELHDPASQLVLNWCEGIPGKSHSEHEAARDLESLGFAFTGAGSAALELAGDKRRVKRILERSGVPTPQ
ncbi:MAG TPA: hypothetical protein VN416_05745, partial [Desulfomonilia bacterium]|nr:hypothetical protein [Desulfomonilia bacterium]